MPPSSRGLVFLFYSVTNSTWGDTATEACASDPRRYLQRHGVQGEYVPIRGDPELQSLVM